MSVQEIDPAGHQERAGRPASAGRHPGGAWLPPALVRYRVMALVPLVALAGVAVAALAGLPDLADLSTTGSGCCPPRH